MNPFAILSLDKTASKTEIMAAVAATIRTQRYEAKQIAEAQKELFDSVARGAAEFRHCIDITACLETCEVEIADHHKAPELEMLDYCDEKGTTEN